MAELLKRLLDETGYLPALLGAGQARGRRNVEKLLATARASGTASLRVFLEYAEAMRDTAAREGEARAVAEGAVQIMTAHAAKGLEFSIVVLGDANRPGGGQRAHMLHPGWGLLLRLTDADKRGSFMRVLASQVEDAKDAAEAGRLLYVAATRAAEKLVLSGELSLKKDGTPGSLGGWLKLLADADALPLAKRAIDHDPAGSDIRAMDMTRGGVSVVARIYEPGIPELVRSAPLSEGAPDLEALPLVAALPASGDRRRDAFLSRVTSRAAASHAPAWVVGKLVHRAAQLWRVVDADPDWLKAEAQNQGLVEPRQIDDAARRAIRILDRFARHPLFALLEGAEERLHEVPFAYVNAGHPAPVHGVIDCLYRRGGRWHVVDFKTDHVRGQDQMRAKLDEGGYVDQVRQYADAVEGLLGERPWATLCFLDVNDGVEVADV